MIQGKDNLLSWLRRNGPYWKLYRGLNDDVNKNIENSITEENYTSSKSEEDLSLLLSALQPGVYYIKASRKDSTGKPNFSKGFQASPFEILTSGSSFQAQQVQAQQPASIGNIGELKESIRAEILRDIEHANMKKRLAELEKEREEPTQLEAAIAGFLEMIKPYAPALAGKFLGPQAALITGVQPAPAQTSVLQQTETTLTTTMQKPENEMDQQELGELAMNKIDAVYTNLQSQNFIPKDKAFVDYLYKLALIAEKEPGTFITMIQMLEQKELN